MIRTILNLAKMLADTQDDLYAQFTHLIEETDHHATELSGDAQIDYLTKQSIHFQQVGIDRMQALTSKLITAATDMSPLNFKTDMNL